MIKSKRLLLLAVLLLSCLMLLAACGSRSDNDSEVGGNGDTVYGVPADALYPDTQDLLDDPNYNNIMIPDKLDQMLEDKKSFFVYYFSASCTHCKLTTPQLKPLADELDVNLHQFNLLEFQEYFNGMDIEATPTLVYYKDGVEVERMLGGLKESETTVGFTLDDFRAFFEKHKSGGND